MIVVAAFWITAASAAGRALRSTGCCPASIVQQLRRPARICPQRDDRGVGNRTGRRGPVQPPARRPEVHRTLFGRLLPDQRRRGRHFPLALPVGPARCESRTGTRTSTSTPTTATNSTASRCASPNATCILPGSKVRWRFQVAQSREMLDDADQAAAHDPVLELLRVSASAC